MPDHQVGVDHRDEPFEAGLLTGAEGGQAQGGGELQVDVGEQGEGYGFGGGEGGLLVGALGADAVDGGAGGGEGGPLVAEEAVLQGASGGAGDVGPGGGQWCGCAGAGIGEQDGGGGAATGSVGVPSVAVRVVPSGWRVPTRAWTRRASALSVVVVAVRSPWPRSHRSAQSCMAMRVGRGRGRCR